MDRRRFMTAGALMAATLALQGCDSATPVMDDFIVDINNLWHVDTDSNHTFFFKPSTVGAVAAASFTGNEEFAGKESNLSGSFNREQISFTVVRSSGSVLFSGTFSDANTMDLTSNGSSIRLKRG